MNGGGDEGQLTNQLKATIALQQEQIDSLNSKLTQVMDRLDKLEARPEPSGGKQM